MTVVHVHKYCYPQVKTVPSNAFENEVLKADVPVLVDFFTNECGPCRNMLPVLEALEQESQGRFKIVKINAADDPQFTAAFGITTVPVFVLFRAGDRLAQCSGVRSKKALVQWMEEALRG